MAVVDQTASATAGRRRGGIGILIGVIVLVVGVAGVNFAGGLGRSSLFVDEAFSWIVASHPIGQIYDQVKLSEVAPPGYYAFLHVWLDLGNSDTETWMRIPSVIAGLCLVGATMWLCRLLGGVRAMVLGGTLVAVSPLILTYAQQIRAYVFVMLTTTLAISFAIAATRSPRHGRACLVVSGVCAVAAIWLHYTCLGAIIPLAVWVTTHPRFRPTGRAAYVAVLLVAQALVTPLLIHQASTGNPGADAYSHLNATNLFAVLGNPVDGQYARHLLATVVTFAALLAAAGIAVWRQPRDRATWLLIATAFLPMIALVVLTVVAKPVLISRYCTVSAPLAIAVVATAFSRAPRLAAIPTAAVLVAAVIGSVTMHEPASRWPDIGAAYHIAGKHWQPSDVLVLSRGIDPTMTSAPLVKYYSGRYLPAGQSPLIEPPATMIVSLLHQHRRLWLISNLAPVRIVAQIVRPYGYRVALSRALVTDEGLSVNLAVPRR